MVVIAMLLLLRGTPQAGTPDLQIPCGVVRDQTGAVLTGAQVELSADTGGVPHAVVSDAKGEFLIDRVVSAGSHFELAVSSFQFSAKGE